MADKNWFEHLENLDRLYGEDFFRHQKFSPQNIGDVSQQLLMPSVIEEAELSEEASLSIDIFSDEKNLYLICPMAGAIESSLDIWLENDLLTIKGSRQHDLQNLSSSLIYHECFWGKFSRSIVLPVSVDGTRISATLRNGILKIVLPKSPEAEKIPIQVISEE